VELGRCGEAWEGVIDGWVAGARVINYDWLLLGLKFRMSTTTQLR